ncbi:MAG TPA: lytic murein transglycosylase [Caulobacteraceae bacterium]|jgi:lytic murein transglycosylase
MDRRAFLILSAASVLQPEAAPPAGSPDTPGGPDPQTAAFEAWLRDFTIRAIAAGWDAGLVTEQLAGLTVNPKVVELDTKQPEFVKSTGDYVRQSVTEQRVETGRRKRAGVPQLPDIETRYGVPSEILTAIWAQESAFGQVQGDLDVIRSLASLAFDGRRRDWAETQILAAFRMIQQGDATRAQLHGSWAGAMGQTQLIPEAFLSTAVDGDGDGKRDIWNSAADALASAANLMARDGWRRGETWAREVILPAGFDYGLAEGPMHTPGEWAAMGALRADGLPFGALDRDTPCQMILPAGAAGPAFLIFPNHLVIRKYNNSTAYALSVGLLADRISGTGPLATAWPIEPPMSMDDRAGAQRALLALGFDPGAPDGVIGVNTRVALRAWQKAKGLPADGHLTQGLSQQLQAEAGPLLLASPPLASADGPPTRSGTPAAPTPATPGAAATPH